jgi:hypothetical protein
MSLSTEAIEVFVVSVSKLVSADEFSVILVATHGMRVHHRFVPSEIGLKEPIFLYKCPELPGGDLVGHPAPKTLS